MYRRKIVTEVFHIPQLRAINMSTKRVKSIKEQNRGVLKYNVDSVTKKRMSLKARMLQIRTENLVFPEKNLHTEILRRFLRKQCLSIGCQSLITYSQIHT